MEHRLDRYLAQLDAATNEQARADYIASLDAESMDAYMASVDAATDERAMTEYLDSLS